MICVDGGSVYIHRGDDASFDSVFGEVTPEDVNNNVLYFPSSEIPEDGTEFLFTVKVDVERPRAVIKKKVRIWNGFATVTLPARDTAYLPFGEYKWDIRLLFPNVDGLDVNTPFNSQSFFVTEVVGNGIHHAEYPEPD